MTRPTFTEITPVEDNYDGDTVDAITVYLTDTTVTVSPIPIYTSGYMKLVDPNDSDKCELLKFTGNAAGVLTILAVNRGLGGTTAQTHDAAKQIIFPYSEELHSEIDVLLEAAVMADEDTAFTGNNTFAGTSIFNGVVTINDDLVMVGDLALTGDLNLTGDTDFTGQVDFTIHPTVPLTEPATANGVPCKQWISDNYGTGVAGCDGVKVDGGILRTGAVDFIGGTDISYIDNLDGSFTVNSDFSIISENAVLTMQVFA